MGATVDDVSCGAWGKEKAQAMSLGLMVDEVSGSFGLIDAEGLDGLLCFLIGEENHVRREREPHQIVKPFGLYGQHLMVSTHEILHSYATVGVGAHVASAYCRRTFLHDAAQGWTACEIVGGSSLDERLPIGRVDELACALDAQCYACQCQQQSHCGQSDGDGLAVHVYHCGQRHYYHSENYHHCGFGLVLVVVQLLDVGGRCVESLDVGIFGEFFHNDVFVGAGASVWCSCPYCFVIE